MSTDPTSRTNRLEAIGLVLLVLLPPVFLLVLSSFRRGRDLSLIFWTGSGAFALVALVVIGIGIRARRHRRILGGVIALLSAIICVGVEPAGGMIWGGRHNAVVTILVKDPQTKQ